MNHGFAERLRALSLAASSLLLAGSLAGGPPEPATSNGDGSPRAPQASPSFHLFAPVSGNLPDENGMIAGRMGLMATERIGGPVPAASPIFFLYERLVGTAFNPRTSTSTFAYNFSGCVYETGGTDNRFMAPLLLPEGAMIKFLRLYYDDSNAASDLTAWITRYQPGVTSEDITSVTSSGSGGYGSTLSAEVSHVVDLTNWAYTVIIAPNANAATNSFCGVRVAYYPPPQGQLNPITPCRILDTRGGPVPFTGGAFAAAESRDYDFRSVAVSCPGLPARPDPVNGLEFQGYSVNVTVTGTAGPGFLSLYPRGSAPVPLTSTINYVAGQTIANGANVTVDASGFLTIRCGVSGTHVIVDVNGYYY